MWHGSFFPIFNKTWLSSTGKADICSYNSFPNAFAGWLVTSFNWAKCWEKGLLNSSIFSFRLRQQSHGSLLYLCFNAIWFWHDTDTQHFYKIKVRDHVVTWWQPFSKKMCIELFNECPPKEKESVFSPNTEVCNSCCAYVMFLLYIVKVKC